MAEKPNIAAIIANLQENPFEKPYQAKLYGFLEAQSYYEQLLQLAKYSQYLNDTSNEAWETIKTTINAVVETLDTYVNTLTSSDESITLTKTEGEGGAAYDLKVDASKLDIENVGGFGAYKASIASQLSTLSGNITSLSGEIDSAVTRVTSLETRMTTAEGDITSLESKTGTLESTLGTVQTTISGMQSDISGIESDMTNLDGNYIGSITSPDDTVVVETEEGENGKIVKLTVPPSTSGNLTDVTINYDGAPVSKQSSGTTLTFDIEGPDLSGYITGASSPDNSVTVSKSGQTLNLSVDASNVAISDLEGYSALNSNVQTAMSNASSAVATAEAAETKADSAVSTAGTASSTASSALNTANTASSNASTALSTANTANENASSALSTANEASEAASSALSTANTANSNASTALGYGLIAKVTVALSKTTNPIDAFIDGDYTGNNYYIMLSIPSDSTATSVQTIAEAMPYITAVSLVGEQTRVQISNGSGGNVPSSVNLDILVFKGVSYDPSN